MRPRSATTQRRLVLLSNLDLTSNAVRLKPTHTEKPQLLSQLSKRSTAARGSEGVSCSQSQGLPSDSSTTPLPSRVKL